MDGSRSGASGFGQGSGDKSKLRPVDDFAEG